MSERHVLTILATPDKARLLAFYRAAFPGWTLGVDVPPYAELALPGGARLGLYQREGFAANVGALPAVVPEGALAHVELYLHVDDLELVERRLEAAGARLLSARAARAWGDEASYWADPDGNVVVCARPLAP